MESAIKSNEIEGVIEGWCDRHLPELVADLHKIIADKDREIESLKKEVAGLSIINSSYQSVRCSGDWIDLFLIFTTNKHVLYDFLFDRLSSIEKSNLYRSILDKFSEMPKLGKNELQKRKKEGALTSEQVEIFDAICRFSTYISDRKK